MFQRAYACYYRTLLMAWDFTQHHGKEGKQERDTREEQSATECQRQRIKDGLKERQTYIERGREPETDCKVARGQAHPNASGKQEAVDAQRGSI